MSDQMELFGQRPPDDSFKRGMSGSELASRRWTEAEIDEVDRAIETCARLYETFTADDIWALLPPDFLVTKGLASRLNHFRHAGVIAGTDRVAFSQRKGVHGHGQRLAVWKSLVRA